VQLSDRKEGLAIQENTQITRYNYTLTAKYELRDAVSNRSAGQGHGAGDCRL
jgi:hypothetical protein